MLNASKFLTLFLLVLCHTNSHTEKINDIQIFLSNIRDHGLIMEASLRSQYNTYLGDKVKTIGTLTQTLKIIQNNFPPDLEKYQSIDLGLSIVHAMNDLTNVVRKNVLLTVKSFIDDAKIDETDILYEFVQYIYDFIENVALSSKNLFNDGMGCVMDMEPEIKAFIDLGARRFMECFRTVSLSHPLTPPNFRINQNFLTTTMNMIAYRLKVPFWYTWLYSTKQQNDTAANSFNDVSFYKLL